VSAHSTLESFYAAVVARDLAAARRYLADDLEFVGLFETYRSADQYMAAFTGLLSITLRLEVKTILAEGNEAAVFFELQTKAPAEATVLVAEWHRVRDGKIVHVQSAFDGRPYEAMFAGAPDTAEDERAIHALKDVFADALLRRDARRRASIWTEDGTVVPPQGGFYRGRDAMEKHFATEAPSVGPQSTAAFSNYRLRFLDRDTAFVDADLTLGKVVGPDGKVHDVVPLAIAFTAVRRGGAWFIQDERAFFKPAAG
jgi:uncharacterized protein (TIGR02246 family)